MAQTSIRDNDVNLLKLVADKTSQSQVEVISQALIMYAEELKLIKTTTTEVKVVKRTYDMADQDWTDQGGKSH